MRDRLATLIKERYGDLGSKEIAVLSRESGVSYTTLARFLIYRKRKQTKLLRRSTVDRLAIALRVTPSWLVDGQGAQQLGFWPALTPTAAEMEIQKPAEHLAFVMERLKELPPQVLIRTCRAALSAAVEALSREGLMAPQEAYRCLMRLDALQTEANRHASAG